MGMMFRRWRGKNGKKAKEQSESTPKASGVKPRGTRKEKTKTEGAEAGKKEKQILKPPMPEGKTKELFDGAK